MPDQQPLTVLLLAYGGSHIRMLLPVIKKLLAMDDYLPIVFALTTAAKVVAEQKLPLPILGFKDVLTPDDQDALDYGQQLLANTTPHPDIDRDESIAYLGLSYADLVAAVGVREAQYRYQCDGRQAFLPLRTVGRILDRYRPDVVITTNSPRAEKALILSARERGIPALCIVDFCDPRENKDRLGRPGYADKVCVFSARVKDTLVDCGRRPQDIVVTGNPEFDHLVTPNLRAAAAELINQRGWQNKKVLLWLRQYDVEYFDFYQQVDALLLQLAQQHAPHWHIVIRPHPNDTAYYGGLPNYASLSPRHEDLGLLLHATDAALTVNSMAGLQAAAIGKPLLTLDMIPTVAYAPFSHLELARGVTSLEQLETAILAAFNGQVVPRAVGQLGTAADQIIAEIKHCFQHNGSSHV